MRKSFKIVALILILPVLTYDFAVVTIREAKALNAQYILPLILPPTPQATKTTQKVLQFSSQDLCASKVRVDEYNCTKI